MIQQTSIDQTGVAIFKSATNEEKQVPLFSLSPCEEAKELSCYMEGELVHVFITNNLCEYRIENEIRDYKSSHFGIIPEEFMDQLALGIPFVEGCNSSTIMSCYA